jgi:hypothetical protein
MGLIFCTCARKQGRTGYCHLGRSIFNSNFGIIAICMTGYCEMWISRFALYPNFTVRFGHHCSGERNVG